MDNTLAYLAGAIDADGYITIQRSHRRVGKRYAHAPTYYLPKLGLGQASPIVPELLKKTFGGSISHYPPMKAGYRPRWVWYCGTRQARDALVRLRPFLLLKRRQCELAIKLANLIETQHAEQMATQKPPYRITPKQEAARHSIYEQVTALNAPRNRRVHIVTSPGN